MYVCAYEPACREFDYEHENKQINKITSKTIHRTAFAAAAAAATVIQMNK